MRTSTEKVNAALDGLAEADLSTLGVNAMMAVALRSTLPLVRAQLIPDDPKQLDELLAGCAQFCLALRSDDAPAVLERLFIANPPEAPDAQAAPALEG